VLHGDVQSLHGELVDMHKLSHQIDEVMEFQKWLIIKLNLMNFSKVWKLDCIVLFGPQIFPEFDNFCTFANLYSKS
jgi:hypothetical protein